MPALTFPEARTLILRKVRELGGVPETESVPLLAGQGRVLAEDIVADRDYPPFNRAMRDGFAVRTADLPGTFSVIGESRAGGYFEGAVGPHEAVEIMTGAPAPDGADAVVMVEHCTRNSDGTVTTDKTHAPWDNIALSGSEAKAGDHGLTAGFRIDHTAIAWMATTGCSEVRVYRRQRVAIVATGDEIVEVEETPKWHQIRNSNAYSLAAQVTRAGGEPVILPIARDTKEATRAVLEQAFNCDMVLLSGGVSAGKYDVVEPTLAEFGAEFYFDRVLIQPGAPAVFGRAQNRFVFGLPGNPASTMVTFEVFARAALDLLSGASDAPLPLTWGRLTKPFRHKAGLTRFLPCDLSCGEITPVAWRGSGDVPSLCRSNAYLVADAEKPEYAAGEMIPVLLK